MAQYTPNFNLYEPDSSDNFADFRAEFNNNMNIIDQNLGGGGSGGHTIYDEDGNALAQESGLQFTGNVNVSDDNVNGRTVVDVSGGNNLILDAQIYSTEEKQIGVWTDNKPLYCKTVQTAIPNNSQASYSHNIADIDTIVRIEGGAWGSNQLLPINMTGYVYNNNEGALRVTVTKTHVVVMPLGWDGSGYTGYWNIYYTKTTDVAGSGGYEAYGFSPVIFSDVERCIGVWRDNKPLYQKTLKYTVTSTISSNTVLGSISDIDTVASIEGIAHYEGHGRGWLLPLSMSGYSSNISYDNGDIILNIVNDSYGVDWVFYVTIQYTKTTDVAGSGDYNTYGVPTVHYDTNEQVIGTWIDGKPLYERSFSHINTQSTFNDFVTIDSIANVDVIASLNGIAHRQIDTFDGWIDISSRPEVQTNYSIAMRFANGNLQYRIDTYGTQITDIYITVRYTKTTDV